jgi:NTE family protein
MWKNLPMNKRFQIHPVYCVLAAILLLSQAAAWGQSPITDANQTVERPRVGLVLGGGGARGAAHIGVLQELERRRVPIDAIAGTSMGAIVGGLYASGMTPAELEQLVSSLDWADALTDIPARKFMSFRRKQDDAQYPIDLEAGLRDGSLLLPKGVIQGQKLNLILRELTIGVSHLTDFDDLPIPFRAIASDIERGEPYVMGRGDLAHAIRASMSVPGVFAPVRLDGRLLVDGGIVGNLPVDVIREMGVDIVIAVDVEFPLYGADELDSAVTISEQMLTILIRKETLRQIETLGDEDILIRPELGTFASTSFGEIETVIGPGADAAIAVSDQLQRLSLDESQYTDYLARRNGEAPQQEQLAFVRVEHDGVLSAEILASRLDTKVGDEVNTQRLADDAQRLFGLDLHEQVGYKLVREELGTGVEFQARSKSWGPDVLQFATSLEGDFEGSTAFNLAARLTRTELNARGAEWRTDLQLGTDPQLFSEFHQPFVFGSSLFVSPHIDMWQTNINAFVLDEAVARLRLSNMIAGVDVGSEIGSWGEFRIGAFTGAGTARVKVGDPDVPNISFDTGGVFARFRIDTLDNAQFPRSGIRADFRWEESLPGLGADDSFRTIEADIASTWSRGKNSLQLGLGYATTFDSNDSIQNYFPLGGFLRLSGLERGEFSGPHAALAKLVYYRRVGESPGNLLDVPFYLGASVEAGNVWQSRSAMSFGSMRFNGSVFAGLDTYIGPIYFAAGLAEGGGTNFYLFIGAPPR